MLAKLPLVGLADAFAAALAKEKQAGLVTGDPEFKAVKREKNSMPDIFTKAKRSEVMSRIRSRGNRDMELALASLFRRHGIRGWRRHQQIRIAERGMQSSTSPRSSPQKSVLAPRPSPGCATLSRSRGRGTGGEGETFRVRPDFTFSRLHVAVFVDGCFWHACPQHSTQPRNSAAFWRKNSPRTRRGTG